MCGSQVVQNEWTDCYIGLCLSGGFFVTVLQLSKCFLSNEEIELGSDSWDAIGWIVKTQKGGGPKQVLNTETLVLI